MTRKTRKIIPSRDPVEIGPRIIFVVVMSILAAIIFMSFLFREYKKSIVVGNSLRINMALASTNGEVGVLSFDPNEQKITQIELSDIAIRSRSVGEYKLSSLFAIGNYTGQGGEFVQQKIQGFLRLPITGNLVVLQINKSGVWKSLIGVIIGRPSGNISRLDAMRLLWWNTKMDWHVIKFDTLIREGVVEQEEDNKYIVNDSRLQSFVGSKLFDWKVGAEGATVAVINESGIEGLGSDVSRFLVNVGMDVVSVRTGSGEVANETLIKVSPTGRSYLSTMDVLKTVFGRDSKIHYDADISEYRSDVVVVVGKDMMEMF